MLQNLWVKYGKEDPIYIPVQIMYEGLSATFCSVLLFKRVYFNRMWYKKQSEKKEVTINVKPAIFWHAFGSTDEKDFHANPRST